MAATFDPTLSTLKDWIRRDIGDVGPPGDPPADFSATAAILDETVVAFLSKFGYAEALARSASAMRLWLAQQPDAYDEGSRGLRMQWKARDEALKDLITDARSGKIPDPDISPNLRGAIGGIVKPSMCGSLSPEREYTRSDECYLPL